MTTAAPELEAENFRTAIRRIMTDPPPHAADQTPRVLRPWPWCRLLVEFRHWAPQPGKLYMCLKAPVASRNGTGSDFVCVRQISDTGFDAPAPGRRRASAPAPRRSSSRSVAYVELPLFRNWTPDELMRRCRSARGLSKRLQRMVEVAHELGLSMVVDQRVLDPQERDVYDAEFHEYVRQNEELAEHLCFLGDASE